MAGMEPVSYWQKFKDYTATIWNGATGSVIQQVANPINVQMANLSGPVQSISSGIKWGLIICGVLLAFFVIAEVKSVTGAFKA